MNLSSLVKGILNLQKEVDIKKLPSLGLFYNDDFKIYIKRADTEDIIDYEYNYVKDDVGVIINKIKKIVKRNTSLSSGYSFNDIKSIDIVFLFLEIVKFTKKEPIYFIYTNDNLKKELKIEFSTDNFNYFKISDNIMSKYDKKEKCFLIDGYKYTLPSIGIENCLTNFLIIKSSDKDANLYNNYFYDFTHFVMNKNYLSFDEIENIVEVFNFDMEESELKKVKNIISIFEPMQRYSLMENGSVIEMNSRIDLEKIWK
jgi:hypothetical protein